MSRQDQFISLIQQHSGIIRKAAVLYADTREDQEDLTQEIVGQLWRAYGSYAGRAAKSTWMYRIAMNVGIHYLKKQKKRPLTEPLSAGNRLSVTVEETPEADRLAALRPYIARLSRLEKGILFLYLEDKSYAEIAAVTGLSETTVGSRLSRIREKLRKQVIPPAS